MRSIMVVCLWLGLSATAALAQTPAPVDADSAGIRAAALDYIEGWYEGSVERMTRALHPELVKRIIAVDRGASRIDQMGASKLIANVRGGGGTKTPKDQQQKDVTILDRFGNAAVVKIVASDWIDYLQLGKVDGRWVIINVLWELKPKK